MLMILCQHDCATRYSKRHDKNILKHAAFVRLRRVAKGHNHGINKGDMTNNCEAHALVAAIGQDNQSTMAQQTVHKATTQYVLPHNVFKCVNT